MIIPVEGVIRVSRLLVRHVKLLAKHFETLGRGTPSYSYAKSLKRESQTSTVGITEVYSCSLSLISFTSTTAIWDMG